MGLQRASECLKAQTAGREKWGGVGSRGEAARRRLLGEPDHANFLTGSRDGVSPVGFRTKQGDPHPDALAFVVMPLSGKSPSLPSEGCDEGQASPVVRA